MRLVSKRRLLRLYVNYVFGCLLILSVTSCNEKNKGVFISPDFPKTSLKHERVTEYPARIDSLISLELDSMIRTSYEIKSIKVFHPAIVQTEPSYKEFVDQDQFDAYVSISSKSSKLETYCLKFDKYFNCFSITKGYSPNGPNG